MLKFWLLLLSFLTLAAVADGDAGGDDAGDDAPGGDDPGTGDPTLDDLLELSGDDEPKTPAADDDAEDPPALKEARRRERVAREDADRERSARIAAEDRARAPARPNVDPETEAEDRRLAEMKAGGADETTLYWARFQIEQKREMRATRAESRQALSAAADIADKAAFDRLEVTKPGVYKKYAEKVEKAVQELASNGQRPARMLVLRMMLGDDIMKGTLKPKKQTPKPQDQERTRTVGTRSDVRGNGKGNSEREKRIARLENQRI